jgi:hypothetical protein
MQPARSFAHEDNGRAEQHVARVGREKQAEPDAEGACVDVLEKIERGQDPDRAAGDQHRIAAPLHRAAQRHERDGLGHQTAGHHQRHGLGRRQHMQQDRTGHGRKRKSDQTRHDGAREDAGAEDEIADRVEQAHERPPERSRASRRSLAGATFEFLD